MPNLAAVLKTEVSRLARKELRVTVEGLRKTVAAQRSDLAGLKKRVSELEKQLKAASRSAGRTGATAPKAETAAEGGDATGLRFRAAGMASNRKRLGLSASDFGLLVGASGQSVYQWEQGKSKPSPRNLLAIAALRSVGKREVSSRLAELKGNPGG